MPEPELNLFKLLLKNTRQIFMWEIQTKNVWYVLAIWPASVISLTEVTESPSFINMSKRFSISKYSFYSEGLLTKSEVLLLGHIHHCAVARKHSADMLTVRNGHPGHAGDVVLQLASLWLHACDPATVFIWLVWSQNGYPGRTLHEVTSCVPEPLLSLLVCNAHLPTERNGFVQLSQAVAFIWRSN